MDVSTWKPPPTPLSQPKITTRRRSVNISPKIAGVIGTLLVHWVALQSAMWGSSANKVQPPETPGVGAMNIKAEIPLTETLILLALPAGAEAAPPLLETIASLGQSRENPLINVISDDSLPRLEIPADRIGDQSEPAASVDSGDPANQARLFGIYSGQIQARIERGWQKPRTPVGDAAASAEAVASERPFHCQVQIIQDSNGAIQEILLPLCNGSAAWQRSLVTAVQQASPLPAPPDPNVYSRSITLSFTGYSFGRGADEQEYELAATNLNQVPAREAPRAPPLLNSQATVTPGSMR